MEVKFAGVEIKYIIDSISKKQDRNYNVTTFLGKDNSNDITHLGNDGTVLSFKSIIGSGDSDLLSSYRSLSKNYTTKAGVLVGATDLDINGNYYLTGYDEEKQVNNSYVIVWEFTEYRKPNIVEKTFKRIGKSATKKKTTKKGKSKKTTKKKNSTYITSLLTDCGTLTYGMTGKKCVKYLQKFLQKKGYYKGYKVDGDYLQYTRAAVKKMQSAYKIKVSKSNQGQWDKTTRDYWRKKYNITSKKKSKK